MKIAQQVELLDSSNEKESEVFTDVFGDYETHFHRPDLPQHFGRLATRKSVGQFINFASNVRGFLLSSNC